MLWSNGDDYRLVGVDKGPGKDVPGIFAGRVGDDPAVNVSNVVNIGTSADARIREKLTYGREPP